MLLSLQSYFSKSETSTLWCSCRLLPHTRVTCVYTFYGSIILLYSLSLSGSDSPIHLGRSPAVNECAGVQLTCIQCDPFPTQRYTARDQDTTFVVEIGPSANPRGYTGITGTCSHLTCVCVAVQGYTSSLVPRRIPSFSMLHADFGMRLQELGIL